jgi:hypothetical protein
MKLGFYENLCYNILILAYEMGLNLYQEALLLQRKKYEINIT